jgi:lipoprotein-anchoring transpeptidase ErfK/SrfK
MNRRIVIALGSAAALIIILILAFTQSRRGPGSRSAKAQADTLYKTALSLEQEGKPEQAVLVYQELITEHPNFKQISDAEKKLWELNIKVLFSPVVTEHDVLYKVVPKDTLIKIARQHNTTVSLIKKSNNLRSHLIRPGKRLKVSEAAFSVIVDKSQNTLSLKANDEIFKVYTVATGKYNCTPTGTFTIVDRLKDPDWYKAGQGIIPADSPENVLGTRWLGLSEPGYGIHGGAKEEDITKQVTNGCVRMRDREVEELFTILPLGTEVTIVE